MYWGVFMRELVEKAMSKNISERAIISGKHLSEKCFSQDKCVSDIYALFYVVKGRGVFKCDGKVYDVQKDESFMVFPETEYSLECDALYPWELKYIEFHGVDITWILSLTAFSKATPIAPKISGLAEFYDITCADMHMVYQSIRTHAMLYYLFSYYIEHFPYALKLCNSYVEAACEYILANYVDYKCTPSAVSEFLKLDRTYLYKLFKKETGVSVGEYISRYRVERASVMLKRTELSVKNIAIAVGFMDQLYFSRVFKKYMHMSPTVYRKTADKI